MSLHNLLFLVFLLVLVLSTKTSREYFEALLVKLCMSLYSLMFVFFFFPFFNSNMFYNSSGDPSLSWQQQGQGQQPQQSLSVVTTVWGLAQTTQSGPFNQNPGVPNFTNTTMSSTAYSQQQQGFPGNQPMQKQPYGNPQNMQYQRQNSAPYNRQK